MTEEQRYAMMCLNKVLEHIASRTIPSWGFFISVRVATCPTGEHIHAAEYVLVRTK